MRTFIGELVLRLKDDASAEARRTAQNLNSAMNGIEQSAKRLGSMPWGGKFQQQLDKLGAGSKDIEQLRRSWDRLYSDMTSKNLSRALQKSEIANWKTATLGHFAQQFAAEQKRIRDELQQTERHFRGWRSRMKAIAGAGLVAMGGYTGAYMGGQAIRGGLTSSSEWEREKFRQQMANIPENERARITSDSEALSSRFPSVSITDIAELGRGARSMMGDVDRAMAILPTLVQGMVTLQSTKGTNVAVDELRGLLRGIDNMGKNSMDAVGVENTRQIIEGMIRAAQIEGADLDVGKLFMFAQRGKSGAASLSPEFLATTAPAFMQDMSANGFGTAVQAAFKAFIIGASDNASKKNLAEQRRLGIRGDDGLIDANLFGTDPYAWVNKVLIPRLRADGVDLENEVDVNTAVSRLTRNGNAANFLGRMVTQKDQIDRLRDQYGNTMGTSAAGEAGTKDPFVAYEGFLTSMRNLAAAVGEDTMPTIVAGLNSLTGGINGLQQAWRDGDPLTKLGLTAGAGAAGFATFKVISAIWSLATAGPALNAAAVSLQAAAVSLGAGGTAAAVGGAGAGTAAAAAATGTASWLGSAWALIRSATMGGLASQTLGLGSLKNLSPEEEKRFIDAIRGNGQRTEPAATPTSRDPLSYGGRPGLPGDALEAHENAVAQAQQDGAKIKEALSPTAAPVVDTSSIQSALTLAQTLLNTLGRIGTLSGNLSGSLPSVNPTRAMNSNMADQGVSP